MDKLIPGLSLSFLICTMEQIRLGLPALTLGSKYPWRSGNNSNLRLSVTFVPVTLSQLPCALRGQTMTSGLISLTLECSRMTSHKVWKTTSVPQKAAISSSLSPDVCCCLPGKCQPPGEADLGSVLQRPFQKQIHFWRNTAFVIADLGPGL